MPRPLGMDDFDLSGKTGSDGVNPLEPARRAGGRGRGRAASDGVSGGLRPGSLPPAARARELRKQAIAMTAKDKRYQYPDPDVERLAMWLHQIREFAKKEVYIKPWVAMLEPDALHEEGVT